MWSPGNKCKRRQAPVRVTHTQNRSNLVTFVSTEYCNLPSQSPVQHRYCQFICTLTQFNECRQRYSRGSTRIIRTGGTWKVPELQTTLPENTLLSKKFTWICFQFIEIVLRFLGLPQYHEARVITQDHLHFLDVLVYKIREKPSVFRSSHLWTDLLARGSFAKKKQKHIQ